MKRWLKRLLVAFAVVMGSAIVAVVLLIALLIYDQRTQFLQTVEVPSANAQFVLTTRLGGFGSDRTWAVYRQPLGSSARNVGRANSLFWNYTESGDHWEDAHLNLVEDRYLVFSRGSFRYSLYDIVEDTVLVNEVSPWDHIGHGSPGQSFDATAEKARLDAWVRDNLDQPIGAILRGAAEPASAQPTAR